MTDSYTVPGDLLYTKRARVDQTEGSTARVGITEYAAKTLNDVVYLSLPSLGENAEAAEDIRHNRVDQSRLRAVLASLRHGEEGEHRTADPPELVNQSPYGEGWIMEIDARTSQRRSSRC